MRTDLCVLLSGHKRTCVHTDASGCLWVNIHACTQMQTCCLFVCCVDVCFIDINGGSTVQVRTLSEATGAVWNSTETRIEVSNAYVHLGPRLCDKPAVTSVHGHKDQRACVLQATRSTSQEPTCLKQPPQTHTYTYKPIHQIITPRFLKVTRVHPHTKQ